MKFSEQWLREWVNPELDTQELVQQITMAGLEVDGVEPVAGPFHGVIVGEVLSAEKHPDADKLSVCQVSDGQTGYQVVCGAPNVRAGLKVPFAMVGAVLPGDFTIKKAKIRGVESAGMLCAESELGLSDSSDGIMELSSDAPSGKDFREYMNLDDSVIEVDLTPNRSDCLSLVGLAREVAVLNKQTLALEPFPPVASEVDDTFGVILSAPQACPKYVGRVIKGVNVSAKTPLWMKEKLRRCGVRSIDPVVDVTNFIMMELGQPMHAFDLSLLSGGIDVRMAKPNEKLELLDGQEVELRDDTLVIADEKQAIAIAGIMGGSSTGVNEKTQDIFLESAFFNPLVIAGKARSYGLHTDSSHRFERGVNHKLQAIAIERATQLLLDIVGGKPGPVIVKSDKDHLPGKRVVRLRYEKVHSLLGVEIDKTEIEEILARLGLVASKLIKDGIEVTVPAHRFDISIEADLIEEVGRIFGYNNLPVTEPVGSLSLTETVETSTPVERVVDHLISRGYQEVVTYSFVEPESQEALNPGFEGIALANPISADMSVMRTSLWPGLAKAVSYNQNRQQTRLKFIETGLTFHSEKGEITQKPALGGILAGRRYKEAWNLDKVNFDFYDAKADLESLLTLLGGGFSFEKAAHEAMHPGQCAAISKGGTIFGYVGALHPGLYKKLQLNGSVFIFELDLDLLDNGKLPIFKEFSKFPEVRRDLAIIVDRQVQYSEVESVIKQTAGDWLSDILVFDNYQGEGIEPDQKSLAIGITWQHPKRTLNDEEVLDLFNGVIVALETRFNATLRS
ncbi:MAG: phenylalanine--tRNA ligase subunit beta [Proteobacteria bacterium]|nr:MAG: phenylalanine--tRNA ligase subunit beta [Pseudomonadota bacterium]PIE40175.1 MAG: phenylalanine--tRNA ligase subunit beta [Gammaproteobacteria bacterium]